MHLQPHWKIVEVDLEGCQGLYPGPKRACHALIIRRLIQSACHAGLLPPGPMPAKASFVVCVIVILHMHRERIVPSSYPLMQACLHAHHQRDCCHLIWQADRLGGHDCKASAQVTKMHALARHFSKRTLLDSLADASTFHNKHI